MQVSRGGEPARDGIYSRIPNLGACLSTEFFSRAEKFLPPPSPPLLWQF
jgi:hypothetical protein